MAVVVEAVNDEYRNVLFEFELKELLKNPLKIFPLSPVPINQRKKLSTNPKNIRNCSYLSTTAPIDCSTALASDGSTYRAICND